MNWILKNSVYNPDVTELPETNVEDGSIVVLTAGYGRVQYEMINGSWIAVKALTDIVMYFATTGTDGPLLGGTSGSPLRTLEYAVNNLIPKQIKNLTIHILSNTSIDGHNGYGNFNHLIKTDPSDKITIVGTPIVTPNTSTTCLSSVGMFGNRFLQLVIDDTLSPTIIASGGIPTLGETNGVQYISWPEYNFANVGVKPGQVIYNTDTLAFSVVTKTTFNGEGFLYIADHIFANDSQHFAVLEPPVDQRWIMITGSTDNSKVGKCFPVIGSTYTAFIVENTLGGVNPGQGDVLTCVNFPKATVVFNDTDLLVDLVTIKSSVFVNNEGSATTSFTKCTNLISATSVDFDSIELYRTPHFVANRCKTIYSVYIENSRSTTPKYYDGSLAPEELVDLYDGGTLENNANTGIFFISSVLAITELFAYKSAVTMRHSLLDGIGSPNLHSGVVLLIDSFMEVDGTNVYFNAASEDGEIYIFHVTDNSVLDAPLENEIYQINAPDYVLYDSTSGQYRSRNFKQYTSRVNLLNDKAVMNGILGTIETEPGNIYLRQNDEWVVMAGNRYTTSEMPSDVDFVLPSGLEIFDVTNNRERTWS